MNDFARQQAKMYLERSIATLEAILGVDAFSLEKIPVEPSSALYDSYFCLLHEVSAYKKLLNNAK
jgi:hypothetical protein